MFETVPASWMNLVALAGRSLSVNWARLLVQLMRFAGSLGACTLIFRNLQRRQPALDFLWERRGGILGSRPPLAQLKRGTIKADVQCYRVRSRKSTCYGRFWQMIR